MIARGTPSCSQAILYYYDYLTSSTHEGVPEEMVAHISSCQYCQDELARLKGVLEKNNPPVADQARKNTAISKTLEFHFAHLNRYVTCRRVKTFIPALLVEGFEIKVPTPVTVHIDYCPACSRDIKAIGELGLDPPQLQYLTMLCSEPYDLKKEDCIQTQNHISSLLAMDLSQIDAGLLQHYCHCPDCQNAVYRKRELLQQNLANTQSGDPISCDDVTPSNLFAYVIPYGFDPANDEDEEFRRSLTDHVQECPVCMKKVQELHRVIFDIIHRDDSDTATLFQVDKEKDLDDDSSEEDLYPGWPINVQVFNRHEIDLSKPPVLGAARANNLSPAGTSHSNRLSFPLQRLVKPLVAAAVILIGLLLFTSKSAQAVDLSQIYEALKAVSTIHITKYSADQSEPAQEIWFSNTLQCYLTKSKRKVSFWDVKDKTTQIKYSDGRVDIINRSEKEARKMEEYIRQRMIVVPFVSLSEAPEGAQWQSVTDEQPSAKDTDIDIYELTWQRKGAGNAKIDCKWVGYVDSETCLLKKTRYYEKDGTVDYVLITTCEVDYPDDQQVQAVINEMAFTQD